MYGLCFHVFYVSDRWAVTHLHLSRRGGWLQFCINCTRGCRKQTAVSADSWWRMRMNREFFVPVWFGSYGPKVKGLVCAPARTEPFPAWSVLQTVWVISIQPAAHTLTHKPALCSGFARNPSQSSPFRRTHITNCRNAQFDNWICSFQLMYFQ